MRGIKSKNAMLDEFGVEVRVIHGGLGLVGFPFGVTGSGHVESA
jgi:hypothetical protein